MSDFYDPNDPYGWQQIAAAQADPYGGFYDINADPYGIAGYMTPQMPVQYSTAKWNYGQQQPYSVDTMAKQGNALQDYYQILANPVTQWLNMVSTGNASLDLESLMGDGGVSPYVASLQASDDQYLQTVGQQLAAGASPETIKLQMRQVPELADDPDKLKIYDAAVDNGWKASTDQKAQGPLAQFEKAGLTNPLKTYTEADLPADVGADKGMINRWFGGPATEEPRLWAEYGDWHRNAAEALRRQNEELLGKVRNAPQAARAVGPGGETQADVDATARAAMSAQANQNAPYSGATSNAKWSGERQQQRGNPQGMGLDPAQVAINRNNARIKEYEARIKEADKYNKGPRRASVDQIVAGVNRIRAAELAQQGRTPARDQARSMMNWLAAQNYG